MKWQQHYRNGAGALVTGFLDLLYPRCCIGCGEAAGAGRYLCWNCLAAVPLVEDPMCTLCGDPVEGAVDSTYACSWCRRNRPAFDIARSAVRYRGVMRTMLHAFKYQHATHLAGDLALLLEGCVRAHLLEGGVDAVAYVPLHPRKARARSYNQSRLLAEALSLRLGLPLERNALRRVRWTGTQTRLDAEARKANVAGAFRSPIPDWVMGRRWLLIDDVMTTGATAAACAEELRRQGAVRVAVATVARG